MLPMPIPMPGALSTQASVMGTNTGNEVPSAVTI